MRDFIENGAGGADFIRQLELSACQMNEAYAKAPAHPEAFDVMKKAYGDYPDSLTPVARSIADCLPKVLQQDRIFAETHIRFRAAISARAGAPLASVTTQHD